MRLLGKSHGLGKSILKCDGVNLCTRRKYMRLVIRFAYMSTVLSVIKNNRCESVFICGSKGV